MYNSLPPHHTTFFVCDKPTLVCNKTLKNIYINCVMCVVLYVSVGVEWGGVGSSNNGSI